MEGLRNFSLTLQYLELDLSDRWMSEGENALAPLGSLTQLKDLRITHRRDGLALELKAFENLCCLERLYYDGMNHLCFDDLETCSVLDLSKLTALKSAIFIQCSFCACPEEQLQMLILPENIKDITCVNCLGSKLTRKLIAGLATNGVRICEKDASRSHAFWSDLHQKYGPCYPLDDEL